MAEEMILLPALFYFLFSILLDLSGGKQAVAETYPFR